MEVGQTVTCAETGKQFTIERQGMTFNYATDAQGNVYSDEGVDIRERRELLDRSKPFTCYLSSDGKHVTGWKGNILGTVTYESTSRTGFYGSKLTHIRVRDVHGAGWYGKGSGRGMCINLRPMKNA